MPDQSTDSDAPMQAPPDLSARPEGLHVPIDRLPLAYILCDAEMRVLDWNRAAVGIFGYTKRDAMGRTLLDLIIPQPLDEGLQEVIERVRAGDMHAHSVNGNLTKDGRVITCEWFNTPLMAADGRCVGAICLARDITERKRAEEALVRDALLLANVRDSVIVTDLDGIVTYWNEGATRLFGWRAEEMLGRPYADRFPEPKRSWVAQQIRARAEGTEWSGEYLDDRKDGSRVWIHARVSRLADASGRPVGVLGLAYDISDRKRAEQELTRQNEILQAVFDHIPVMIKFTDPDGRVRLVNRHWEGVTGWSAAECRDRDVLADLYPDPEDRRAVLDYIRHPPPGWSYFKTTTRDGRTRDTTWANVLLSDDTSIGFGLDVTDRLRAEERLRESEERFRQLAENIDGYFWLNALDDDQFFYISPGYETVTGRRCEDLYRRPRSWTESIHPEDRDHVLAAVGASFDAEPRQVEYRIVRPDGSVRWIRDRAFPVRDASGAVYRVAGIGEDITDSKRAEADLRASAERLHVLSRRVLEVQEEERRHLARELHDEIGQVLSAISVNLQAAVQASGTAAAPRLQESIAIVDQAIQQVRNLSLDLRPSMLDDLGLVATLRWYADRQAQRAGFDLHFSAQSSGARLPAELVTACYRVAQEALTNVVRHARARRVWLDYQEHDEEVRLAILDDGVGFDPTVVRRRAALGASFGVLGMQERVKLLGGRIDIESRPGRGTSIRIRIPMAPPPPGGDRDRDAGGPGR